MQVRTVSHVPLIPNLLTCSTESTIDEGMPLSVVCVYIYQLDLPRWTSQFQSAHL